MDPHVLLAALLRLPGVVPVVGDKISRLQGKPVKADRERLAKYVGRLDERRVFFHPFSSEVVESCVGSLKGVKEFTDEALADVENPAAKAILGAILDATRKFLDKWSGFQTPGTRWGYDDDRPFRDPTDRQRQRTLSGFFEDLGELRGVMKLMVAGLQELDPTLKAPNLMGPQPNDEP